MNARVQSENFSRQVMTNAIRFLAADAVQAANSGHPGAPLGMAEIALVLWTRYLKHNPGNPAWFDRDRFVLSNGHGSMLLYALLYLSGYDLPLDELKRFRQLHSKTPGHPEFGLTPGVETTTGPLGQGLANGVGMALAEALLAREFNCAGHTIVDHHTYVFLGDGCLMEGISHEAASLAGTLGLGKLICCYDDNGISIDGEVRHWFADDTPRRFEAYGWHVVRDIDGHDTEAIDRALTQARAQRDVPSLLCCKTVIGKGSPGKAGSHDVHGAPLGADEIAAMRELLDWPHAAFDIPSALTDQWNALPEGRRREAEWQLRFDAYAAAFPEHAAEFRRRIVGELPAEWSNATRALLAQTQQAMQTIATRKASQNALDLLAPALPELLGGSADLTGSNLTNFKGSIAVRHGGSGSGPVFGNHINYGVREFAMSAAMNGIALHGGYLPYGGTFLTFSDYSRNAIRMAALMRQRVIFVLTHDSIGLGEDGPTHQPIEHVACLRLIPNLRVWRPCDATETFAAWLAAIERRDGPSCLILSRQNLPAQVRNAEQVGMIALGGYVLADDDLPHVVAIATGSELALAMQARSVLAAEGIRLRVVSMPCVEVFAAQSSDYRDFVLPRGVPRIAIEAGSTTPWYRWVGADGAVIGIDRFGESAPAPQLFELFGLTAANVASRVRELVAGAHGDTS
jgi:transketolase